MTRILEVRERRVPAQGVSDETAVATNRGRVDRVRGPVCEQRVRNRRSPRSLDADASARLERAVNRAETVAAYGINLIYLTQSTTAPLNYYDNNPPAGLKNREFDLTTHWIMLGGARYMRKDKFEPYGGLEIGMVISNLDNPVSGASASNTNFAWGLKLGTNIFFSEKVGLKLQADLRSATQAAGGGLYFGTGGAGVGVSSYSTIYQFGLGGGLVFRFPKK